MLKQPASIVLASLRGLNVEASLSDIGITGGDFPFAKINSKGERPTRKCGLYLLASSLAAALLDGLFEHPARVFSCCSNPRYS